MPRKQTKLIIMEPGLNMIVVIVNLMVGTTRITLTIERRSIQTLQFFSDVVLVIRILIPVIR